MFFLQQKDLPFKNRNEIKGIFKYLVTRSWRWKKRCRRGSLEPNQTIHIVIKIDLGEAHAVKQSPPAGFILSSVVFQYPGEVSENTLSCIIGLFLCKGEKLIAKLRNLGFFLNLGAIIAGHSSQVRNAIGYLLFA